MFYPLKNSKINCINLKIKAFDKFWKGEIMQKYSFDAVIFDLDGVVTKTALLHSEAWKETFDQYLQQRKNKNNKPFREFTHEDDYLPFVDGKPKYEGVKSFFQSRGINIPFGDPSDTADKNTICGSCRRIFKNDDTCKYTIIEGGKRIKKKNFCPKKRAL